MARTGRELAVVHGPQLAAQGLLGDRDPELLPDPLDEIDDTPAHHPVNRRDRARVDDALQGLSVFAVRRGLASGALPVARPSGPLALKRSTQPRTVCRPTAPIRAASERDPPS